ncbi:glycosyltransferase family A protein [Paenibacillus amylolyticus]|nr:glycosyltransferase family A protein [Paenibacillus amylolyticus]WFR64752.1 glycosyltransferase family A protein [Paenibacillus amylolyticus]
MKGRSGTARRRRTAIRRTAAGRTIIKKRQENKKRVDIQQSRRKSRSTSDQVDLHLLWKAGQVAGSEAKANNTASEEHARLVWNAHASNVAELSSFGLALKAGKAFMQGYAHGSGLSFQMVPLPLRHSAAAVVCACNEEHTLGQVLLQLKRLPLTDIIVVLNGTTDDSLKQVLRQPGLTVVYEPDRAGHDVGRALGAKMTDAETVLFVDGDMVVPAEELAPFLFAVDRGQDVALNNLTSLLPAFAGQDEVSRIKAYLNRTLGRADLGCNSMTAVPHALSRRMIQTVKPASLAVPPKAQSLAIQHGMSVSAPSQVDVIRSNRLRPGNTGSGNDVARLIIGDHLEALATLLGTGWSSAQAHTLSRTEVAYRRNAR